LFPSYVNRLSWEGKVLWFGKKKDVKFLKEPKGKDRILSEEEEARLLEAVRVTTKSQHLESIIITAMNTGMRKGEILNLKWSNVDFKTGYILVEETKNGRSAGSP
jgi:integrase